MLIATYDYWGYYNVAFLGDEIEDPGKNIPRALLLSILLVAGLYLMMNVCILAVVPWREMVRRDRTATACMLCRCSCRGFTVRGRPGW